MTPGAHRPRPTRKRRYAAVAVVAAAAVAVGVTASTAASSGTSASCQAGSYDGATLTVQCSVPQATATVTVPGPTVTATTTVTATPTTSASPSPSASGIPLPSGWSKVTFFDDFTGGLSKWNVRNNTWASNELSIDTNRSVNVFTDGQALTERAQRESYTAYSTTRQYTSAYLDTIGKESQQYGRWEMRAKLPASKGLWPAFWLRGNQGLGEIDVMESVGGTGKTVQTVHQSTNGDLAKKGHEDSSVSDLTTWHVYAVEREPGAVRWYIDDRLVFQVTSTDATWLDSTFNEPMNIRLNLQVGGSMPNWYGLPVDSSTILPADFTVDYVRVLTR